MVARGLERSTIVVGVVFSWVALCCAAVRAQYGVTYDAGPAPSVGPIASWTALEPAPHTRTSVGVKEPVTLTINTFADQDIEITPSGQYPVEDSMGDVVWSSCPGNCDIWPVHGSGVFFYGGYFDFDVCENITAEVWDSRTKGLDPPTYRSLQLLVKVPTGNVPYWFGPDAEIGFAGPPNNSMGVQTVFAIQVQPNDVNFTYLDLREVVPQQSFPWPDGAQYSPVPWLGGAFRTGYETVNQQFLHNIFKDSVGTLGPWNVSHLLEPSTQQYQDAQFNVLQHMQFKISEQPETWKTYQTATHPRWFRAADFRAKVGWQGTGNAETQTPRGPYMQQGQ